MNDKYTLEQIKEIVKEKFKWCQDNKKDCLTCKSICSEHRILNLINEVENDN